MRRFLDNVGITMRHKARLVGLALILAATIGGCGAGAATANVRLIRPQADLSVREMSVRVAALAGYEEFTSHFASATRELLRAQGLRVADDSADSDQDVRYQMNCIATPQQRTMTVPTPGGAIYGVPGAVHNVTVSCRLHDGQTQSDILRAEVYAVKGWGPGFGREEAQPAAERLVEQMALRGVF